MSVADVLLNNMTPPPGEIYECIDISIEKFYRIDRVNKKVWTLFRAEIPFFGVRCCVLGHEDPIAAARHANEMILQGEWK